MPDTPPTEPKECIMAFGLRNQKFLFISPEVCCILGYAAADFLSNASLLNEIIVAEDVEEVKAQGEKLDNETPLSLHYRVKTADGIIKWVNEKRSIVSAADGKQEILLRTIKEYHPEEARGLEEAQLNEKFLNSLIDSQTNFLIRFDIDGCFTFANKQFLKALGYKRADLTGKHFSVTTLPEDYAVCEKAFVNCISHPGKIIRLAHKKLAKNGEVLDTEWEFISVTDAGGEVKGIQGIGHDITHKLVAERELKQAARKLDAFV